MELINTHTHTGFCGHAEGTVDELVEAAQAAGISTLAVTEHYPLTAAFDPKEFLSMPASRLEEYCHAVHAAREAHPDIDVLLGCEFDWLGDDEDRDLAQIDFGRFEVILGSVHFVDGWAFDSQNTLERWEEVGPDTVWRHYFETWCEAVLSDLPFTVMSHPDLVKKFAYYPSFDPAALYKDAAEALRASGRMAEVNTSGSYYPCKEMYPAPTLLREFNKAGIPMTVGTDAHLPGNVSRDIGLAYRLLYECGYREITVPTKDGDRRCITIE